ncbi:MAG: AMP-binding protein [Sphingobium sp.]|uniref:AMP-binding protein n=1 Tax=Sphingobium sp. TaxID=1912891 RepID=UPI0029B12FFE|nr:AMP-binding protein [Sphingobium sp.]MDX3911536.1 AMP-binding protein [Sphingobium sp.]
MNIFQLLDNAATRFPDRPALCLGTEVIASWAELRRRTLGLAGTLAHYPTGSRIVIASKNCPDYVTILFATWAAGHVVVPINFKLHAREMKQIIADSGGVLVFASAALTEAIQALDSCDTDMVTIGSPGFEGRCNEPPKQPADPSPDDLAWLFFTSGTTGRSKGAMLTYRNLLAMSVAHLADFEDIGEDMGIVHAAPMSHGSGLYILPYVARAARQIIPRSGGFDTAEFLALCAHHGGVGAFLAPTMLQRLRMAVAGGEGEAAPGLRNVIYGGGPMYLAEIKKALAVFGPRFCQLYGQGESPMTITGLRRRDFETPDDDVLASVGWPRSGMEVQVVDPEGTVMPLGSVGEIRRRGDIVMAGYWNNPTATDATLNNGWLMTGDTGAFDANGMLTLRDRTKDVIISGGTNIYPREVEEVLLRCPGVSEVSVVGEPDEEWGETVVAFVVLDEASGAVDAARLDAHCLDQIARFKRPKRYIFLDSLPKSSYGKILKRVLIEQLSRYPME